MANIKIAQLTNQTAISDNDLIIVETATSTNKMTVGKFKELLGIQAGGVVEVGSNANGSWSRFQDGTLICRKRITGSPSPAVYSKVLNWTFPQEFINNEVFVSGTFFCIESGVAFRNGILVSNTSPTTKTGSNLVGRDFAGQLFNSYTADLVAIGRWK